MPTPRPALLAAAALAAALLGAAARAAPPPASPPPPRRVHVVFSNHLDVGFHVPSGAPGTDAAVLELYFYQHFPAAAATARALRAAEPDAAADGDSAPHYRYRYLTHAWLGEFSCVLGRPVEAENIPGNQSTNEALTNYRPLPKITVSLFLDCPPALGVRCPDAAAVADFERAVRDGDITWHAFPHNVQIEIMSDYLIRAGVDLTHALDRRFGLPPKATLSQRDVPGLTRAALPALAAAGVHAITIGVNPGSAPADVPRDAPFLWRDVASGAQVLMLYHAGGYSGDPVDGEAECARSPLGGGEALCAAWRGDNEGPHSPTEVRAIFDALRRRWPAAEVLASDFDAFAAPLAAAAVAGEVSLPVVTAEIGDTWIYGVASDPGKLSDYRALLRYAAASPDRGDEARFDAFARMLLKIPEHTWGCDSKAFPGDYERWSNAELEAALAAGDAEFAAAVESWRRQRAYVVLAVGALGGGAAGAGARRALAAVRAGAAPPAVGAAAGLERVVLPSAAAAGAPPLEFQSRAWRLRLDTATGAVVGLAAKRAPPAAAWPARAARALGALFPAFDFTPSARPLFDWASPESPLAELLYSTYDEAAYSAIWSEYAYRPAPMPEWFYKDFGKPGADAGGAARADAAPRLVRAWRAAGAGAGGAAPLRVVAELAFDPELHAKFGAPAKAFLEFRENGATGGLEMDVVCVNKTRTRLPEATWLRLRPPAAAAAPASWTLSKLGRAVSPLDVVCNGSRALHAVDDEGAAVAAADGSSRRLRVRSLDAALVAAGAPSPFPRVRDPPDMAQGLSFCLHNNVWGTNYPLWAPYDDADAAMRFRFEFRVEEAEAETAPRAVVA
jgi:hypothetical protein